MNNSFIGQTLNNRYRLDALLGDGGMGTVYRSFDKNLKRQVAIKLMHGHFARQAEFRQRLIQEAQTAARLDHSSIVRIYDFGESDLGLFIAMEYVGGGSLRDHLQRLQRLNKFLPFNQSLQIGIQMAEALDYAHRQGVIHRDVKPGNIMLKRLNEPDNPGEQPFRSLLTDFGLVKLQEGSSMTQSGATVGTPTYMSPEQCEGRSIDGRSDVYSLGIVLYELVTNRLPFAFQTLADAISTHRQGIRPSPPSEYRADAPGMIDSLLSRALAKSPDQRFATAREMAQALRGALVSLEGAPTRVLRRQELSILARVDAPPSGYDLLVKAPGHEARPVPLAHAVVTMGRNADNDIVLPADGVSRHHARLQATSLGWEVVDLGGINGTWIDNRRLRPNELTGLATGSILRIGPYELTLDGPELPVEVLGATAFAPTLPGATTPGLESSREITGPLGLFLAQENFTVEPGQQVELRTEVVNNSTVDDRVMLRVQGVPEAWIVTPSRFVAVAAGETAELVTVLRPPRQRSTPTGRQRVRVQLVSQRHPNSNVAVTANLNLGTFVAFGATLEPQQVRVPGTATVSVKSTGNAPAQFSVTARDPNNALKFYGEKGRILLQPDEVAHVPLEIELQEQDLIGSSEIYPYEVLVVSRKGGRQTLQGEAQSGGRLPPWLLYLLIFLGTLACALLAIAALVSISRGFLPGQGDTPTPISEFAATETAVALTRYAGAVNAATMTAIAAQQTVVSGNDLTATALYQNEQTATAIAATAVVEGDNDKDGLSNGQEADIGTDPNNPDTDGDQLTDGNEVLIVGTNPLKKDTENDQLDDGQEVLIHKTNPRHPDTDGDGYSDGQEVLVLQSDPLDPNDPQSATPTATITKSAPEMTATAVSMTATAISANATATSVSATATAGAVGNGATATSVSMTATANANNNNATATSVAATATAAAGANNPPVANDDPFYSTNQDTAKIESAPGVLGNDTDLDGDPLTTVFVSNPSNGTLTLNLDGSFNYTPDPGFNGVDSFTYRANDGTDDSNMATVTITVNGLANNPPVANDDPSYSTDQDTALVESAPGVLGNDIDVDGDPLTTVFVSNPSDGTLTLNPDGSFIYTPDPGFNGVDTFTYRANDGTDDSNIATVTITVNIGPPNASPVAVDDPSYATTQDTVLIQSAPGVLANDTDAEGDPLTTVFDSNPSNGTLTLNADGSFIYTPDPGFNGVDTFTYKANDGTSDSNVATVTVTVNLPPPNASPVAVDDPSYTTSQDTVLIQSAPGVLTNDTDAEGDPLTTVFDSNPFNGTLTLNADGSFIYTPDPGFNGVDTFTYKAYDGTSESNVATVTITVNP